MINYAKLYQENLDFVCETLYGQMSNDAEYLKFIADTNQEASPKTFKNYCDQEAVNKLKGFQNITGADSKGNSKKDAWKIISYFRRDNPYLSDNKAFKQFSDMSEAEKSQMQAFIANPDNLKDLQNIFKINFSADFCANTYHRCRINQGFNEIKGFENSEFIPELDKGNCTKGLTLALCRSMDKHGLFSQKLPRDKESWAHPVGMYQLVNQSLGHSTELPQNVPLGDYLRENEVEKGTIFIINGHHAMLYTGEKNDKGEPLCHAFNPEMTDYPLKLDKPVYGIDIPAFVKQQCGEQAPQLIDEFVADVKKDVEEINFPQIFKQRLAEILTASERKFDVAKHLKYYQEKVSARQNMAQTQPENKTKLKYQPQHNLSLIPVLGRKA